MTPAIDAVRVRPVEVGQGDDAWFVAVQASATTGWYGPVSAETAAYVESVLANALAGEPAMDHHRLHTALSRASTWDTTPVASWAIGAVDCAAWDLHGQLVQTPVAQLLASSPRWTVPLYASWLGVEVSPDTLTATARQFCDGGWRFTKWGLRKGSDDDIGAEATRLAAVTRAVAAALAQAAAFDAVFTWDAALTDRVAERLDHASVLWLEDPLPDYDLGAYRALTGTMPLAIGERLLVHADGLALLGLQPRAFTVDVVACGGLTRAVELVEAAQSLGISTYPHGRSFVPAVHLAAAYPRAVPAVEYRVQWEPARQQAYAHPWRPVQGTVTIPRSAGLGANPRSL